jgi:hypothetical protein
MPRKRVTDPQFVSRYNNVSGIGAKPMESGDLGLGYILGIAVGISFLSSAEPYVLLLFHIVGSVSFQLSGRRPALRLPVRWRSM